MPKSSPRVSIATLPGILLLGLWLALSVCPSHAPATEPMESSATQKFFEALPSPECVAQLRQAQIAHEKGDYELEKRELAKAAERFPEELTVLQRQLHFFRRHEPGSADEKRLAASITGRLADPELRWPHAVLGPLTEAASEDPVLLRSVLEHLVRRRESGEAMSLPYLELERALARHLGMSGQQASALEAQLALEAVTDEQRRYARWQLSEVYQQLGEDEKAAELLRAWLEKEDKFFVQAAYLRVASRLGWAEEVVQQARNLFPGSPSVVHFGAPQVEPMAELFVDLAWNLMDGGHSAAAETLFHMALEREPERLDLQSTLLYLYGTPQEILAFQAQEAGRRSSETDPQTLFGEGTQLLTAGDVHAALPLLRRAAEGLPKLEAAWYNLGMAAYRVEDWETADRAFAHAVTLKGDRAESYFFRGLALEKLGQRCAEVVESLEKALELDADRVIAHYYLAACYRELGEGEKSSHHAELYRASQES